MPRNQSRTELQYDDRLARGLKRARKASGIGFREAAREVGLDATSIWRIETGEITPTLSTLAKLVSLYQANLNIGLDGLMLTWMEEPDDQ